MEIVFCKSKWEMWHDPIETFLDRTASDGFDATELYLATVDEPASVIARMHNERGLRLVGQILTEGETPEAHIESFDRIADVALDAGSLLVNVHAGRDIFSFADNVRLLERIVTRSRESGVPFTVETHRSRPTYSAIETRRYLEALPELRLTADFSHWMVVHESDLSDQEDNVRIAIERSDHIHARVGYAEGPQVPDPRADEWRPQVDRHVDLWTKIFDARHGEASPLLTITPEFGPPDYMHTAPYSRAPVADAWEVNVWMLSHLRSVVAQWRGR
jgi:sugar phosphate isomerase/epimerase